MEQTGIYIRVSTEDQARDGFSISAQKEKLTKYAEINDWVLFDYYIDDGISGKNIKDRPEMQRLLDDIKAGNVQNVLVYKLDRLTRSLFNLMELIQVFEQHHCALNSQTERLDTSNAVGRMFVKIIGTFAEFERENLAERVSFGYEEKTRQGNYTNTNGVFGYDYVAGEQRLVVNEIEACFVRRIYDLYLKGSSFYKIAGIFNSEGVSTKRGGKWAPSTIRSILTNPLYIGRVRYGVSKKLQTRSFEQVGNDIPLIMEEEVWQQVQRSIAIRKHNKVRRYPSQNSYFFSVMECQYCGSKLVARQQMQHGTTYITYTCKKHREHECSARGFSHLKMETAFTLYLSRLSRMMGTSDLMEAKQKTNMHQQKYVGELSKLDKRKQVLRTHFIHEQLSLQDYQLMMRQVEMTERSVREKLSADSIEESISFAAVSDIISDLKLNWLYLTKEEKHQFLEQFVDTIVVAKEKDRVVIHELQFKN